MVRAHSLLYAIYVCLLVSVVLSALLYTAGLYDRLNLYYLTHEKLYTQNRSLLNFAVANIGNDLDASDAGIDNGYFETRPYGMFKIVTATNYIGNDTIASVHLVGQYKNDATCLYLANYTNPLTYSGNVILKGNKKLPSELIRQSNTYNSVSNLTSTGTISISDREMPSVSGSLDNFFKAPDVRYIDIGALEKLNDSLYFNSFLSETKYINIEGYDLENVIFKGNFVLRTSDSLNIKKTAILKDVIVEGPALNFEKGFEGNLQIYASSAVTLQDDVVLTYPSVVALSNPTLNKSHLKAGKNVHILGDVLLYGSPDRALDENYMEIGEGSEITGTVYCKGRMLLNGKVNGCVYTGKFIFKMGASTYENHLNNVEIDQSKLPGYFLAAPMFDDKIAKYGIVKKML